MLATITQKRIADLDSGADCHHQKRKNNAVDSVYPYTVPLELVQYQIARC